MRTLEGEQFLEEVGPNLHNEFGVLKGHLKGGGGVRDRGLRLSHHCGNGNKSLEVVRKDWTKESMMSEGGPAPRGAH